MNSETDGMDLAEYLEYYGLGDLAEVTASPERPAPDRRFRTAELPDPLGAPGPIWGAK